MHTRTLHRGNGASFARALATLRAARVRSEVIVTEVPAPTRIAPHAAAFTAEVIRPTDPDNELASGRFVVLHDPSCPEGWDGAWRLVTFSRTDLDAESGEDPVMASIGWSWVADAIAGRNLTARAESGTVTRVLSEGFGGLADRGPSLELEIRASWTPVEGEMSDHLLAWTDLLCTLAGIPPLPTGVISLPGQRR